MKNNSILIISNNAEIGNQISNKIKLLRECDTIKIVSYIEAISALNSTQPSMIILYCSKTDSVGIVKEIRNINALDKVPIIFVMDNLVEDILFYAFDNGIDDFFFLSDADSIVLMRIFLTLQKSILYKQIDMNKRILVSANIVDNQTGIYYKEQAPIVLRSFFSQSIEENLENTIFMYVKPTSLDKKPLDMNKIASTIKSIPRTNDIVTYGKSSGFYIVLYNSGIQGAKSVATRITNALINDCNIFVNAAEITTSFEEMEPILYQSMKEQISTGESFNYLYDLTTNSLANHIEIKDEHGKKFKDFKKEFYKNLEKIIAPVFYHTQATYSEKLKDVEIDFKIKEEESIFKISKETFTSELLITYPTYIKLIMDVKHMEENSNPSVRRLIYDFEEFSEEKLSLILKDIINEFLQRISLNTIK